MSQPLANQDVTRNNERLFSLYEKQLQKQTLKDYADTAIKLAAWLSDVKAYYTAARPQIVNLLVTAEMTLRKAVEYPMDIRVSFNPAQFLDHPLTASYVRLVQSVAPFRDLFIEPHLKEPVIQMLRSVEAICLPDMSLSPPGSVSANPQLPFTVVEASGSQNTSEHPMIATPAHPSNTPGQSPSTARITKGVTRSPNPETVESAQGSIIPATLPSSTQTDALKVKVKAKKKKKIDISAFVQADRQDFERKQAQARKQVLLSAPPVKSEPETDKIPPVTGDEQHAPVSSQRSPIEGHTSLGQHAPDSITLSSPPEKSTASSSTPHVMGSSKTVAPSAISTLQDSQTLASVDLPTRSTQDDLASTQHLQISISSPSVPAHCSVTSPLATSPVVQGLSTLSLSSGGNTATSLATIAFAERPRDGELSEPQKHNDRSHVQDHDNESQQIQSAQTQVVRPFPIPEDSELGRLFKWHREYQLTRSLAGEPTKDVEMHTEVGQEKINTSAGLADDLTTLDSHARVSGKLLQVLALSPGHPGRHSLEFAFDTSSSDMESLLKWVNRSTLRLKEVVSCYCLSLGCYSTPELKKAISRSPEGTPDDRVKWAVESLPSIWPRNGGLTMNVSFEGSRKDLPLSPPFVVTGDGLVDVSEFIVLGNNRLQIHLARDFSDYTFAVQVHTPKFQQLQEVIEHRKKEIEWKDWLMEITGPLKTSTPEPASESHGTT